MHIRKAATTDMDTVKRIAKDVIFHNYTSFLGIDATTAFVESGMSDREIEDGIDSCVLLEENHTTVAFAITKENLLHLIMVDVPFQHTGFGSALLAHVETELFRRFDSICLQSFRENGAAARFYQKHGWLVSGQADVPETDLAMVQYEKKRRTDRIG